jgi:hypothetical protein
VGWDGTTVDKTVKMQINIYDSTLLAPVAKQTVLTPIDVDNVKSYEKTATYKGYPSREQYFKLTNNGKFSVLVGDRFILEIKGNKVGFTALHEAAGFVNIARLDSLK